MDSTVGPKMSEMSCSKDYDQQHKVQIEARHQWCAPGIDTGAHTVQYLLYDLDDGTECAVSKSAHDKRLGGVADTQHDCSGPGQAGETGKEELHEVQ